MAGAIVVILKDLGLANCPSYPTIIDHLKQLDISLLRKKLIPGNIQSGIFTWYQDGDKVAAIGYTVEMAGEVPHLELSYTYNGRNIKARIRLESLPSNLGKGTVWYFLCPVSSLRCRKLYLFNGYWVHRQAIRGGMYQQQTKSHQWRRLHQIMDRYDRARCAADEADKENFRSQYAGRATRRFKRLMKAIERIENDPGMDLASLWKILRR